MIGLLFLAISPLLSTVSAVCCLPNNPPGAPNLDCPTYKIFPFVTRKSEMRCCYVPKLSSTNCRNDYNQPWSSYHGPATNDACHTDSTNNEANGRWICVSGKRDRDG
ncbi:hypothetical protein Ptr902_03467 [Pyrenophora tritici-repentis]|nr:hypothetical protein PtrV1_08517 [Pyrenophora tritici-repentis]KAF7449554.1 hypothetical protein A1F99_066030 [Pyrenophora tritici-repentis]KAI0574529.1 hypothetical protein Alg215_08543 [Pyrenophora tritici-repentis]KAI0590923.1 hypothetical protein Alg130_01755 [Pyrenophora tritici-repentis]KAI0614920.1 hypothetical protein TUN205_00779 [Pyrenophora tritici-repentis]